ncbi:MAG: DUF4345 domain-containing protein [Chthoniobacterales bacterium]|jgi:hypothetical protein|nr:DUF4345 domain-containing protein [Chthoniobacterales bacterium]
MKAKRYFLIFAFVVVSMIALLYGISPQWFAQTFLDINELSISSSHILRALMCLYLAVGVFWLYSAFSDRYRNTAVLTTVIFSGGLVIGRIGSLLMDGWPKPLLVLYLFLELGLIPVALWIFKLPEE